MRHLGRTAIGHSDSRHIASTPSALHLLAFSLSLSTLKIISQDPSSPPPPPPPPQTSCRCHFPRSQVSSHHHHAKMWKITSTYIDVSQQVAVFLSRGGGMSKEGNMAKMFPIQRLGYPPYPSLSKLLNKKGYLGYLPQCTLCLKASPRLSRTHLRSLDRFENTHW